MTMRAIRSIVKDKAGFGAIEILVVVGLVGALTVAFSPGSNTKEFREEFKKNILAPMLNSSKPREQTPANNNPWMFAPDPSRQTPQSPPPAEQVRTDSRLGVPISPNWSLLGVTPEAAQDRFVAPQAPPAPGGVGNDPGNAADQCEAQWESRDGGRTKTLVPGSCTKPYHGPACSLAAAH